MGNVLSEKAVSTRVFAAFEIDIGLGIPNFRGLDLELALVSLNLS